MEALIVSPELLLALFGVALIAGCLDTLVGGGGLIVLPALVLAGIPPLVGFHAKLGVLQAAVNAGHVAIAVAAVMFSLIGAFYYLRIIKVIYFDEPAEKSVLAPAAPVLPRTLLLVNGLLVLGLGLMPGGLIALCLQAMRATLSF